MEKKAEPIQADWALDYDMKHKTRGRLVIFNNRKYPKSLGLEHRKFSDIDAIKLKDAFMKGLGFVNEETDVLNDKTAEEIQAKITEVSKEDYRHRDCVVIAFMGYGEHNLVWAKDRPVGIQVLLEPLKGDMCHPSLVGKPKIIILQTDNPDFVETFNADGDDELEKTIKKRHVIPTEADFIYLGSEMPGLITNRDAMQGSIFISHLAKNIKELGTSTEIRRVMTRTLRDVEKELDNWEPNWMLQNDAMMPYLISMLTKDLRFTEKQKS